MFNRYVKIFVFILGAVIGIYSTIIFLINFNSLNFVTINNIFMSIGAFLLGIGFLLHSKDTKQENESRSKIYKTVALFFIITSSLTFIFGILYLL